MMSSDKVSQQTNSLFTKKHKRNGDFANAATKGLYK